jgi:polar amino acid transport system substrate-binding protein
MVTRRNCLLGGWLLGSAARAQRPGDLRFALGQSWGPPFLERVGTRVTGGLLPDLMNAIAAELGLVARYEMLPPLRVERAMDDGSVDLHCLLSPTWWPEVNDPARWSVPLLRLKDVLVASPQGPATASELKQRLASSEPLRVATVRGYRYPTLEDDFKAGRFVREEAFDQWSLLEMLARNRAPLGVVNSLTLRAYQQRAPRSGLHALREVQEVATHCLLSAKPQVPAADLQEAISQAVRSGRVQRVLARYEALN